MTPPAIRHLSYLSMIGLIGSAVLLFSMSLSAQQGDREEISYAVAQLSSASGSDVQGTVYFVKEPGGKVRIKGTVSGLAPGKHGFHVHQYGDCRDREAKNAGGHFNPRNNSHGAPNEEERHTGDLGNIEADESGQANIDKDDKWIAFSGEKSILGRALVVHEKPDQFSQPSGDAGKRVACGVIGLTAVEAGES